MNPSTPPPSPRRRSSPERRASTQREREAVRARSPRRLIRQIREANIAKVRIQRSAGLTQAEKNRAKNAINRRIQRTRENLNRHLQRLHHASRMARSVLNSARSTRNLLRGASTAAEFQEARANVTRAARTASTAAAELRRLRYFMENPHLIA